MGAWLLLTPEPQGATADKFISLLSSRQGMKQNAAAPGEGKPLPIIIMPPSLGGAEKAPPFLALGGLAEITTQQTFDGKGQFLRAGITGSFSQSGEKTIVLEGGPLQDGGDSLVL